MSVAYRSTDVSVLPARSHTEPIVATDGELLMRFVRHRDHGAFAQIVERHGRLVWMICRQVLRHHQDVEDAFQATFLILAERAHTIRASDSAAAWLFGVAQRTALAARRKRTRRREESLSNDRPAADESASAIDNREMLYILLQEIQNLPARYQTPLVMRYLEGQSRRAIADQTDSTVGQIQGRLVRGRRLLRSRFLQRGVSLSLAAGAVAGDAAMAEAVVTPALVDSTTETCLKTKTSGTLSGLPPLVLELVREGVNAMWVTFAAKCTAVVATVAVAGGIVWAAQQPAGNAAVGAGSPAVQVDLLSANDKKDSAEQATARPTADKHDAAQGGRGKGVDFLIGRLKYKIPIEIGDAEFKEGGHIEIEEVWGTRPKIDVGGQYLVRGKYVLPHGSPGKLYFYESATGNWGQPMPDVDLQTVTLDKESGEFTLLHEMRGPGYFHLYLASPEKYSHYYANVYFGTGENVLRSKEITSAGNTTGASKQSPASAAAPSAKERLGLVRVQDTAKQRADYAHELSHRTSDLRDMLEAEMQYRSESATKLELLQLEKADLQRQLEPLNVKMTELDLAVITSDDDATKEAKVKQNKLRDNLSRNIDAVKQQLREKIATVAKVSQEVELKQLEVNRTQRRIDELDRMSIQFELPQEPGGPPTTP